MSAARRRPVLRVTAQAWPIAGSFTISRGTKREAHVVLAEVNDGMHQGRGECVPYARYGESVEGVLATLEALAGDVAQGLTRLALQARLPPGAARNALDCALLDFEAKASGRAAHEILALPAPAPAVTAFTLSLAAPQAMAQAARAAGARALLKLKLGPRDALACVRAVRDAAPQAQLIVDANEAWTKDDLLALCPALAALGVALIEQPLAAGEDGALDGLALPIPLCADESVHGLESLGALGKRYRCVNIKLDKTGGLTEAVALAHAARARGLDIMVGCMVATSLAMAPAFLLSSLAKFIDLDGPLLLARDRDRAIRYDGSLMYPPDAALWG